MQSKIVETHLDKSRLVCNIKITYKQYSIFVTQVLKVLIPMEWKRIFDGGGGERMMHGSLGRNAFGHVCIAV